MENLVRTIKAYVERYGSFDIEYVDTKNEVVIDGGLVKYFTQEMVRADFQDGSSNFYMYKDLEIDSLLDILYVVMEYAKKKEIQMNYIDNKNEQPEMVTLDSL